MNSIQKEREAFEVWYCKNHTGLKQSDLAKFRTLSGYSFSDSLKINISWEAWQAAKAQAVPELTDKMIVAIESEVESQLKASAIDADPFRLDGEKIWYAALEAQEST
ncbi:MULTISPECIES: hypothetical protein [Acinetobacter]|uniref:hypothetical protein n=1 Tax=Acinetobacter TaxID=469 RepID=UPI0021CD758B|nr:MULTISPECIES: hypothetical protein [Acinetobacter]MCU4518466.1 hypothetical protein [Acinetobacter radioresistens]MDU4032436.1 hypothetical protein [Acinetobacter sp.]